ncbi:MAG: carcinine hydrolase/isopenicillin-N N-acyltransferase family protein, partial [Eisenbergiella sp.]
YAPLDGMNEKGLAVSVNMIQDSDVINQDTGKPDVTTTTAIRLLLDRAADVEEALTLLRQYDMHSSMGMMVHFALADKSGRSVAVEYIGNEMVVTETPVVTNFYLAPGEKQGIGTSQSHTRYEILMKRLNEGGAASMDGVRDALDSVSKDNFGEFESTEWSIVFNLEQGEARYYHRENYENSYLFRVNEQAG